MGRRRTPAASTAWGIPSDLYYGIDRRMIDRMSEDPQRQAELHAARREWSQAVRSAGYTVLGIRKLAETDEGYQRWQQRTDGCYR